MEKVLARKTIKNSAYGFLSYVVPIFFTIFLTPLIINKLGIERYGLFVLVSVITTFFGLLTFGLSYGVAKVVSEYHGHKRSEGVGEVIGSTLLFLLVIGIIGFISSFLIGFFGLNFLRVPFIEQAQARILFVLAGLAFIFSCLSSVFTSAIASAHRLDLYTKVYLGGMIVLNVGMIGLLNLGYGVTSLVVMQLVTNIGLLVSYYLVLRKLLPEIPIRIMYSKKYFLPYLKLNVYAYVHESAATLLFQLDKVLISTILGPAAVSYYNIAGTIGQKIQGTVGSLTSIFLPVSSSLLADNQHDRLKYIYRKTLRMVAIIGFTLMSVVLAFGKPILKYWVGPEFLEHSLIALYVLAVTYFILGIFTSFGHFMLGMGKVKQLARYTLFFLIMNVVFLVLWLPGYGITGAAYAYLASLAPMPLILYFGERRFLNLEDSARFYFDLFLKLICTAAVYFVLMWYLVLPLATSLLLTVLLGGLSGGMFIIIYRLLGFFEVEEIVFIRKLIIRDSLI